MLVKLGADKNARAADGSRPLHFAAAKGQVKALRVLAKLGAALEATDVTGVTALHRAAYQGSVKAIKGLVALGAEKNPKDKDGRTPLHSAALNGQTEAIRVLAELGAEVEAADYQGARPVHWAKNAGQYGAVEALRKLGADVNAPNPTSFLIADMLICSTVLLLLLIAFMSPSAVSSKAPHAHSRRLGRTWRRRERRPLRRRCGSLYPRLTLHSIACSRVVSDAAFLFRG